MAKIALAPKTLNSSDIVELIRAYGVDLSRVGDHYRGLCPFHPDTTPSLFVYPETDSWFCYGCQKGWDDIQFVREIEGCSFSEAKKRLGLNGGTATRHQAPVRRRVSTLRTELRELEETLERVLVRRLKGLDRQLQKREITLCQYYTNRAIAEDRLNRFDALRTQNHYYLRNWR